MDRVCRAWVELVAKTYDLPEPIYEFGAKWKLKDDLLGAANTYNLSTIFPGKQYVGVNLNQHHGVDLVADMQDTGLPAESVGSIICLNTLEHVENPLRAVEECYRLLRPGGWLLLQSVFWYPLHSKPQDYWRFTQYCFEKLLLHEFTEKAVEAVGFQLKAPKWIAALARKVPCLPVLPLFEEAWNELGQPQR